MRIEPKREKWGDSFHFDGRDVVKRLQADARLVDDELTDECVAALRVLENAFSDPLRERAANAFLKAPCAALRYDLRKLLQILMMEALPAFVREQGGKVILVVRLTDREGIASPVVASVRGVSKVNFYLQVGTMYIAMPGENVIVTAESESPFDGTRAVCVQSDSDAGAFFANWEAFARRNSFLRGKSFFADGTLINNECPHSWDDVFLPQSIRREIELHVENFLRNITLLKQLGMKARRGLILAGPPGTGKTLVGKVLADTLPESFIWVTPRHIEDASSFEEILELARFVSPAVLFLEDIDLFAEEREGKSWMGLGELMNQLDGAVENDGIVTIATTNRLEIVEKALRNRPGRFDRVINFEEMDETSRRLMLSDLLADVEIAPADLAHLVTASSGCTGAQLQELVNTVFLHAVEQKKEEKDMNITITKDLIEAAMREVRHSERQQIGFSAA